MGIFQRNQRPDAQLPDDELTEGVQQYFDGYFQELNERGRAYFDDMIQQQLGQFQDELQAGMSQINADLRAYLTKRIDEQIADHAKSMRVAQAATLEAISSNMEALQKQHEGLSRTLEDQFEQSSNAIQAMQATATKSMERTVEQLDERHRNLGNALQKTVARQDAQLGELFEANKSQALALKESQDRALEWINLSVERLRTQQEQLSSTLEKSIAAQQEMLIGGFEQNMAQIIEYHLLGALGEQYDLKAQLPAIIQQLEANKQAIMEDMRL